jgi:hypothetical protein
MLKFIEDCLLAWLQKRCKHPGQMCAVDILEACGSGTEVAYCNRCGAVSVRSGMDRGKAVLINAIEWRRPDPHLWRG